MPVTSYSTTPKALANNRFFLVFGGPLTGSLKGRRRTQAQRLSSRQLMTDRPPAVLL
jgi:hypothetical protein